jgi:MinD-like ATPase involved in chromosome partitioning or flagellar assembly
LQTITFYSYKGGVGRTLVVANVAKYLARFGQKVFAIDFDLEAPGLHYKLSLGKQSEPSKIKLGVVDYIYTFSMGERLPDSLKEYVIEVEHKQKGEGSIHLMPAGNVPSAQYWSKLAQINWHELFYSEGAKGIPFFLELKERIEKEFTPDFLLIDSRAGITEIGGVATTVLPDKVVCLLLNNRENLEGAREVLRSIKRASRLPGQNSVEIVPVVTRIPKMEKSEVEERIVKEIRNFINEDAGNLSDTLDIPEVLILHSEPDLQILESLHIGSDKRPGESPLLMDYLRLFSRLVPNDVIEPHIVPLVQDAAARAEG